ncbi:transposase [Actinomycetota bacterium]
MRPRQRCRGSRQLSLAEREEISRGLAAGESMRSIASGLGRAPSTISRELTRSGGRGLYRAHVAEREAWKRARRPQVCKLAANPQLRRVVEEKLQVRWSPQQISRWLADTSRGVEEMQVSHETIYLTLFIQARGGPKRELTGHLRTRRANRRPAVKGPASGKGRIVDPMLLVSDSGRCATTTGPARSSL